LRQYISPSTITGDGGLLTSLLDHALVRVFRQDRVDSLVPDNVAVIAVDAEQMTFEVLLIARIVLIQTIADDLTDEEAKARIKELSKLCDSCMVLSCHTLLAQPDFG
jgi:hypothetical protein